MTIIHYAFYFLKRYRGGEKDTYTYPDSNLTHYVHFKTIHDTMWVLQFCMSFKNKYKSISIFKILVGSQQNFLNYFFVILDVIFFYSMLLVSICKQTIKQ